MAGTVRLHTTHDRPGADLVARASGRERTVRAFVDTGGGSIVLRRSLAEHLDLVLGAEVDHGPRLLTSAEPPELWAGDQVLDTDGVATFVVDDDDLIGIEGEGAELLLPAAVLRRHHVVFDYVAGELTFGAPGELDPQGVRVPAAVHPDTGFVRVEVQVAGRPVGLLLDTGPSCCLIVDRMFRTWRDGNPGWPAAAASVGPANMAGLDFEVRTPVIRVPELVWGPFTLPGVMFAYRADANFDDAVNPGVTEPVDGALAGNVLKHFRVELDYARGDVWLEQRRPPGDADGDMVGVVVLLDEEGFSIGATLTGLDDVRVGDHLVSVDGRPVEGLTLGEVIELLRGQPGDQRRLELRREKQGEQVAAVEVVAPVARLL